MLNTNLEQMLSSRMQHLYPLDLFMPGDREEVIVVYDSAYTTGNAPVQKKSGHTFTLLRASRLLRYRPFNVVMGRP
jgi:hypothetical protein